MSTPTPKMPPAGPLREPLPPIYPIPLIEVACRALQMLAIIAPAKIINHSSETELTLNEAGNIAARIIRDGLASHELAAKEGRSRG